MNVPSLLLLPCLLMVVAGESLAQSPPGRSESSRVQMVRMVVPWRLVDRGSPALSGRDWIAKPADNICGLRDPNQLSSPALVDFRVCLDATPEVRRMREQNIDPASPKGIQLHSEAVNRVTAACEAVRMANGHCSVWKEIRHKDGRVVANITELVKAQF